MEDTVSSASRGQQLEADDRARPEALAVVRRGHQRRLAGLDPLVPEALSLVSPPAGSRLLTAVRDDSSAVGVWQRQTTASTDYAAAFSWLRRHRLTVLLDGPDRYAVTSLLLDRWCTELAREPEHPDPGATIRWPARDADGVASLVQHGFFPTTVTAVRSTGLPRSLRPARRVDGIDLRPAQLGDIDAVSSLRLEAFFFDDRLGGMHLRPSTERSVHTHEVAALSRHDGTRILAARNGHPVGLAALALPDSVARENGPPLVRAGSVARVECLSVTEGERSRGIGQLLADALHRRAAEAGADLTLVHYAAVNPYSTRFWNAQGYRPLWITWSAPLSRLR